MTSNNNNNTNTKDVRNIHYTMDDSTKELFIKSVVGNTYFSLSWTKNDGEQDTRNGRLNVYKYIKGTGRTKNDDKYLTLHMPKEGPAGYRSIRISTISEIRTRNRVITFKVA